MITIQKYSESFAFVECDFDEAKRISEEFEFYAPNYMFSPKYKNGFWDRKIRLFDVRTCLLPIGLTPRLVAFLRREKYGHRVDEALVGDRGPKMGDKSLGKFKEMVKLPDKFEDRDYQDLAVQNALYRKKMVILSATSSGKSLIAYLIFNILKYLDDDAKFLLVVPTVNLVEQMFGDFCEYAGGWCDFSQYVHRIYEGREKWTDKPITVSTWQSLQRMGPKYFQQFDGLIVDECHTASAKVLASIVEKSSNAQFKIGMSGTLRDSKVNELQLEGLFGPIKKISRTKDLMDRGYVSKLRINGIVLRHPPDRCRAVKRLGDHAAEAQYINKLSVKQRYVCSLANSRKKNTLVLFRLRGFGHSLRDMLEAHSDKKVFYVDGTVGAKYREGVRRYCETHDDAIVVASYGTFSTGISIKNLHNVVFAESMKSSVKVLQSVGRLLRLHENKEYATLFDVTDDLTCGRKKNYALKQFLARISYYDDEGFTYRIKNVTLK